MSGVAAPLAGGSKPAQAGVRKLTIKPLKRVALPPDFEASSWAKLGAAVEAVQVRAAGGSVGGE